MVGISVRPIGSGAAILPPWIRGWGGWKYGTVCSAIHRASDSVVVVVYGMVSSRAECRVSKSARQALFGRDGTARLRSVGVVGGGGWRQLCVTLARPPTVTKCATENIGICHSSRFVTRST